MIYMVDHVYTDPATEPAWHAWYAQYLHKLVAVPGIHSAQRFKAIGRAPSRYLAMYSIDSADVYSSAAYTNMGGGGSQSARFHPAYATWTRNLFDGAARAPLLDAGQRIVVWDAETVSSNHTPPGAVWLKAVGLHMTTPYRAFAVLANDAMVDELPGSHVYEPFTSPILAQPRSDRESR
jgi:hypothetical protein